MLTKRDKEILRFLEEHKGLTIQQVAKIFFPGKYEYDRSRLRLKKLFNDGIIKRYTNTNTEEYVYCLDGAKELSAHDLYTLNFYAELKKYGAEITKFETERKWCGGKYRTDAFYQFNYNNAVNLVCLEVDFTHMTSIKNKYVPLYNSREIQDQYKDIQENMFPRVVIMTFKNTENIEVDYSFQVEFINFELDDFVQKVLM